MNDATRDAATPGRRRWSGVLAVAVLATLGACAGDAAGAGGHDAGLAIETPAGDASQGAAAQGDASPGGGDGGAGDRILIAYFSRTGNTRAIAEFIQQGTGGDLFEIVPLTPYPEAYEEVTAQARQELAEGYRPPLKENVEDMADVGVIFIGSPIWWGTVAPPVMTFLESHDLSGKTIVVFVTHGGSGLGDSVGDVREMCPDADVLDGLAIRGSEARGAEADTAAWLDAMGFLE